MDSQAYARWTEAEPTEVVDRITSGHVLEAKGTDGAGNRVFRVRVISAGDSLNRRRYPEAVLHKATQLYEGARAFDHHRTTAEMASSAVTGMCGYYRNVEAVPGGLDADLVLLPTATHVAAVLDAAAKAASEGRPTLAGISHDALVATKQVVESGQRLDEATSIVRVLSADVVADPAAGGAVQRVLAGGMEPGASTHQGEAMTLQELVRLLREATTTEARAALATEHKAVLESAGLQLADLALPALQPAGAGAGGPQPPAAGAGANRAPEANSGAPSAPSGPDRATEAAPLYAATSAMGRMLVTQVLADAGLTHAKHREAMGTLLGERFTEAQLADGVATVKKLYEGAQLAGMDFTSGSTVAVTGEELDRKRRRLEAMFGVNTDKDGKVSIIPDANPDRGRYVSIKQAYLDLHPGYKGDPLVSNLAESIVADLYRDPRLYTSQRAQESVDTSTFAQMWADALNKRIIAEYNLQGLTSWQRIVSNIVPRLDFRTNHITRMGGYGLLPDVAEGGTYQALTTPGDEEVGYAISKRGGTEDLTMEAIANDDLGAIVRIPRKLGRAAAHTLYREVWDMLATNPTIYDSVALFDATHANTATSAALADATLSAGRLAMRSQTAYGDSLEFLSVGNVPRLLVVPPELEQTAFQLVSTFQLPASGNPTAPFDRPNIHRGMDYEVVDYFTDANDWFLVADPANTPTIEVGFYQGRVDPELFIQDDPRVGAVFSADKVTYKIRHIYGLTVLDYRGFYRGQG